MASKKKQYEPTNDNFHEINLKELHKEWQRQPSMVRWYGEQIAEARMELSHAKSNKDVDEAELKMRIRKNPAKFELDKVTEGAINEVVVVRMAAKQSSKDVIHAQHKLDMLKAAMDALEHKKKALEDEVFLWSREYFAEPQISKGMNREDLNDMQRKHTFSKGIKKR